ncbi:unnamed protein product [Triticum turgidum subsp. durum]|uniref:Ubiquitin-conjugating enzyme E2 24 n=1 Tax=Triticum turgidum subsp. durum TaxID=4567 RepID=A0A9R0VBH1_TRITD|nr:unnamed protein product [Triticum turgidum subsp. durum]
MDLFVIDSDSESYSGTSDSEDQEECEFTDHAQSILSSLDESIGKIDDFLTFERGFLHGDIVCPVSDPSGQLGRVVGVEMFVDLETYSGDIIEDVNSKQLSRVRSFVSGDCVVMGPWIGRVIRAFDLVTVVFSDGAKCEMLLRDSEVLKPIPPILFEDAPYFYYPSQRVRIVHPSVSKSGTWFSGSWRASRDEGVVSHVDVGLVHVNWITSVANVWGDRSSSPPNFQDSKNLTLLSCFPYANWQLGDWCTLSAGHDGSLPSEDRQFVLEKLAVEEAAERQRIGIVRNVDALERTANVKWIVPVDDDIVRYGSDSTEETVSAYELVEHPDFSFCTGEVVIRSALNIDKSEADLTNGTMTVSRKSLDTSSGFLSCIGNVLGYKDDGIEVQWASGVISKAQHFEIIGLERLLDNSLGSVNEVHTFVDDEAEQETIRHESTKNALEESGEDCTGSLRNAFYFSKTAFNFLTNVASSFFGAHDSTSSSSFLCIKL